MIAAKANCMSHESNRLAPMPGREAMTAATVRHRDMTKLSSPAILVEAPR
jgi:hypothetical protein